MSINEIHKNDIGTVFQLTIKDQDNAIVDLSSATTKQILIKSPNKSVAIKTGSFLTDGTDGIITYTIVENDLNVIGIWSIQAKTIFVTGTWYSDIQEFKVHGNVNT